MSSISRNIGRSRTGIASKLSSEGREQDLGPSLIGQNTTDFGARAVAPPEAVPAVPRFLSVALSAMNIGGSNDTDRVRTLVYAPLYDSVRLTATADIGVTPRTLAAEWWDGALWQSLGVSITADSTSVATDDLDSGLGTLDPLAIAMGWILVRVTFDGSVLDDVFGLHLIFTNGIV